MAEPDYSDRETLVAWLRTQPREVSVAIAARAALRVLPNLMLEFDRSDRKANTITSGLALHVFRALSVTWVAAKYPTHVTELAAAAANVAFAAFTDAFAANAANAAANTAANAAFAATNIVTYTAFADAATANAAANAAAHAATALNDDVAFLKNGKSTDKDMAGLPLWPKGQPDELANRWNQLRQLLLSMNEDWEVWMRWYEARLKGEATYLQLPAEVNESIEFARVLENSEEDWKAGPNVVNAKIREIEERYLGESDTSALAQDPLGAKVVAHGGRLAFDASPVGDEVEDAATRQLHEQVRQKARLLAEAASRIGNQNPALATAAKQYVETVDRDLELLAGEIVTAWSLSVSLGSFRDQDNAAKEASDGFVEVLTSDIRRSLDDLVLVSGPFVRRFAIARELDDELARFEDRTERHEAAKVVFNLTVQKEILEVGAAASLSVSEKASEGAGPQSTKTRAWFIKTVRNVAVAAVIGFPFYVLKPSVDKVAGRIAETRLVDKIGDWAAKGSDAILELFEDAPPDQRGAIEEGLKRMRETPRDEPIDL